MCENLQHSVLGWLGNLDMGKTGLFLAIFMAKQTPASSSSSSGGASVTQGTTSKGGSCRLLLAGVSRYTAQINPNQSSRGN